MDNAMSNKDIIDATQDAVLNAASNVVSALGNTAEGLSHGAEPFYLHAEFWVAAAFVLAVLMLARPVGKVLVKLLRGRGLEIAERIKEAVDLKEDAQKLLADYERKFRSAKKEAADILARSEREVELVKKEALSKLEAEMTAKENEAKARLQAAEREASQEIAGITAEMTLAVVKKILADSLNDKALDELIDASINNLRKVS